MPAYDKALAALLAALRNAAKSEAGKKAGKKAATAGATSLGKVGASKGRTQFQKRGHRKVAIDLARQIGGQYSEGTIIAGSRHYVVWRNGKPLDAFPSVEGKVPLAERPELQDFKGRLLDPPPVSQ